MKRWQMNSIATAILLSYSSVSLAAEEQQNEQADDEQTEVIEVKGIQYSDQKARMMEREKDQFSSVVSTDDIGNFVDQNVAESMRRLPGVSLQRSEGEGKYVTVRGLGPQFVSVNMNGAEMAGAGEDRKVGLDGIAGDSLGSIEVVKTLTPDMNLNSIGGAVNVKSISAFDRQGNSLKLKVQDSYSELREEHSPKFTLDGTHLFADETIGVGYVISSEERASAVNEQRHHSTNTYRPIAQWQPDVGVATGDPVIAPYQVETRQEVADRERDTLGLTVEFRPNDANQFYIKGNYVRFADADVAYREYFRFDTASYDHRGIFAAQMPGIEAVDGQWQVLPPTSVSTEPEVVFVDSQTKEFVVADGELQHQYFIQESEQKVKTFNIGGEHLFGDSFTFNWDYSSSKAREESVDDRRVQIRSRDLLLYGQATKDEVFYRVLQATEQGTLPNDEGYSYAGHSLAGFEEGDYDSSDQPSDWLFDNMFLEDSIKIDEISTFKADLKYDFDSDWLYYVKAGFSVSERINEVDKNRWSFVPSAAGCNGTYEEGSAERANCIAALNVSQADIATPLADGGLGFSTELPLNSEFQYPFIDNAALEYLVSIVGPTKYAATGYDGSDGVLSFESAASDYTLQEDVSEAYVMAEMELLEDVKLITGVRYVQTEFSSTGNMALSNDEFAVGDGDGAALDIFVPLPATSIKYSEFFPSAHLRWEATDQLLVRGAVWTSYTRPTFKQNRAYAQFKNDITLCDNTREDDRCASDNDVWGASALDIQDFVLSADNTLELGNPNLIPMTSTNFDFSVSWYESENLFIEAALFYKDIKNFIVDVSGASLRIDELPITLPVGQVSEFIIPENTKLKDINYTLNGDAASVFGMELSYNQFFESGFFVQSNLTLQSSEAELDPSVRLGTIALPDQADMMANLTVGWENDDLSLRFIGNYRSEILEEIGSCGTAPANVTLSDLHAVDVNNRELAQEVFDAYVDRQYYESYPLEHCKDWTDRYQQAIATLDFKAKLNVVSGLSVYFDAVNLTDNVDLRYYQGNQYTGGKVLAQSEAYGRTVQFGVNYKFY
ncbi:TonB-dependent receptor (plasmid) [Saccharobesus litoralis]|uniref:TonB-dependent receptor n=1 Tax=Saccharobesus litoralis TaxID=2172099 RepID=A0A2S0VYG5_9ALTE|nr:TonB-dependent receptor [Saccharobesus litoralis]AWB69238.1 TonB-dependent receptor [Saccharobesus litoralis]